MAMEVTILVSKIRRWRVVVLRRIKMIEYEKKEGRTDMNSRRND